MKLSRTTLSSLRNLGLDVRDEPTFPEDHVAWPLGYGILKPARIPGNALPEFECWFKSYSGEETMTDAPPVIVFRRQDAWWCEVQDGYPGFQPENVLGPYPSEDALIEKLSQFFFRSDQDFIRTAARRQARQAGY